MLFFNFLCLFYLMVLISGHTIPKNIYYNEDIDDIVDSIHDVEYTREYKKKHDRLHHNYRREEKKDTTKTVQAKENLKGKGTKASLIGVTTEVINLALPTEHNAKKTKAQHLWNKFRNSAEHKKKNNVKVGLHKRRVPKIGIHNHYTSRRNIHKTHNHAIFEDVDVINNVNDGQSEIYTERTYIRKRDVPASNLSNPASIETTIAGTIDLQTSNELKEKIDNDKSDDQLTQRSIKTFIPFLGTKNITEALTEMTTQLSNLKETYGLTKNGMTQSALITNNLLSNFTPSKDNASYSLLYTTAGLDFKGTAQIEELLNEIKMKSIQTLTEQSPAITDMISNTVTETTFGSDPILTHLNVKSSNALRALSRNNLPNNKRSIDSNETVVISNTEPTHNIATRSVKEDVYTIAHNVEDLLQNKLKKVYKKLKSKVSTDFRHEVHHAKTTVKKETTKAIHKVSESINKSVTKNAKPAMTPHIKHVTHVPNKTPTAKQLRHAKAEKQKSTETSTNDDYMMLTLYEQILSKAHQDNIMNILTTNVPIIYSKGYLNRKRDISKGDAKLYEDIMTEDYSLPSTKTDSANPYDYSTETPEDTSFESLSNKLCFNEYVNGYKYYLKFQQDQGNQNFSNLVKYQAHRHHNVDDIGKYILNKIPQVTLSRSKRYFDDDNMDDQEVSTKSDDSWFKRHFYFFIDRDPPRRFHTSQTVTLKSPSTYDVKTKMSSTSVPYLLKMKEKTGNVDKSEGNDEETEVNLDELIDSLNNQKSKAMDSSRSKGYTEPNFNFQRNTENPALEINRPLDLNLKLYRNKRHDHVKDIDTEDKAVAMKTTHQPVIDSKNKKYGYVDVNLIPRPTAVMKLRDNKRKQSRFKNFIHSFKIHKSKKQHEKTKRDLRRQRFNPLKSLKNIFIQKTSQSIPFIQNSESRDYEMMTTHVDTFKPVKYNKVLTMDEISRQIPNITADIAMESNIEKPQQNKNMEESLDFNYNSLTTAYKVPQLATSTVPSTKPSPSKVHRKTTRKRKIKTTKKLLTDENLLLPENVSSKSINKMVDTTKNLLSDENLFLSDNIDSSSIDKMIEITKKLLAEENLLLPENDSSKNINQVTETTKNLLVDENLLQPQNVGSTSINKLFDTTLFTIKSGTLYNGEQSTLDNIKDELKDIEITISGPISSTTTASTTEKTRFSSHRIYIPPHLQQTTYKEPIHDITFHTQNTRVANFPLATQNKHKTNLNIRPLKAKAKSITDVNTNSWSDKIVLRRYANTEKRESENLGGYAKHNKIKPYPDYFNDLLTWHGDVLNKNKVTNQIWDILNKVQDIPESSTPNMSDMEKELMQMKEYIRLNEHTTTTAPNPVKSSLEAKKDRVRSNPKTLEEILGKVASNDEMAKASNNIIIKGETKYLHVFKEPSNLIKYSKTANLINDLNKMYFQSPLVQYNIDNKLAVKRDDIWSNNNGIKVETFEKPSNDSSVMFLDTTLLSYDDGPDFLTESTKPKKIYKNSLTFMEKKSKMATAKPIAKINQSPEQYFSTPLPMKMNEFDKFLKDNEIDVQSVTKPLTGVPELLDLYPKSGDANGKNSPKISQTKGEKLKGGREKTAYYFRSNYEEPDYMLKNEPKEAFQDINKESDFGNIPYVDTDQQRQKRYSKLLSSKLYTPESEVERSNKKFKKRLFKKKSTMSTPDILDMTYSVASSVNDGIDKDVELTIINMDDTDDNTQAKSRNANEVIKLNNDNSIMQNDKNKETQKTKDAKSKIFKNKIATNNIQHKNLALIDNRPQAKDSYSTTDFEDLVGADLLNKLHAKSHHPKRVRISSHSYKYDIIYDKKKTDNERNSRQPSTTADDYSDDESPYNTLKSLIQAIRTFYRVAKILNIVHAVETVEDFTRPNVMIHIELPTYFRPYTGPTEPIVNRKPKSIWNDFVLKYLSGIALLELLSKFGLIKIDDEHLNYTDGLDKTVNAYKVFSDAAIIAKENYMIQLQNSERKRRNRQVTVNPESMVLMEPVGLEEKPQNSREKRRLKLFLNIKEKLRNLLGNKNKHSTAKCKKLKGKSTTLVKSTTISKPKREKYDEFTAETKSIPEEIPLYDFDMDKILMGKINTNRNCNSTRNKLQISSHSTNALSKEDIHFGVTKDVNHVREPKKLKEMYLERTFPQKFEHYGIANKIVKIESDINTTNEMKIGKRDIRTPERYTAKDVAAIEVIVDLVKNTDVDSTHKDANKDVAELTNGNTPSTLDPNTNSATNAIQVHIAIPYNLSIDKKRSINSLKVRKVFAAKMRKPVDLEYQVQSFGDVTDVMTEASNPLIDLHKSTPKMYLLVDASALNKDNHVINPDESDRDYNKVNIRQVEVSTVFDQKTETTTASGNLSKVTLNKDFIAAVNKHLIQLYENLTHGTAAGHHVRTRNTENFALTDSDVNTATNVRRHINWDSLKKYFGHDRVCHCKCRANRTMCRACAASDAVISELIFEFDNLANYMKDHCTEIQTYFWMNPSGGKKLRDSVHRVDQTLRNYFKRVKGQCQGRTCKTFSTCIDKRSIVKLNKFPENYIGTPLIQDLEKLADDILIASTLNISCNNRIVSNEKKMSDGIENCIAERMTRNKLDLQAQNAMKPQLKNVYSLDNINVNIICSPKEYTDSFVLSQTELVTASSIPLVTQVEYNRKQLPYDYEFDISQTKKKKSGIKRFFSKYSPRKLNLNNLFTYYVINENETNVPYKNYHKRQTQVESPLVSDAGSMFWQDYIKSKGSHLITERDAIGRDKASTSHSNSPYDTSKFISSNILHQTSTESNNAQRDINVTGESIETLSYNINELFKIFHNLTDLDDLKNLSSQSQNYTKSLKMTTTINMNPSTERKTTKIYKILKDKLHFKHGPHTPKVTPNNTAKLKGSSSKVNVEIASTTTNDSKGIMKLGFLNKNAHVNTTKSTKNIPKTTNINIPNTTNTYQDRSYSEETQTKLAQKSTVRDKSNKNFLKKLKSATVDLFHAKTPSPTNTDTRRTRSFLVEANEDNSNNEASISTTELIENNIDVIHDSTSTVSPTILIINDYDEDENGDKKRESDDRNRNNDTDSSKLRSLLFSILNFERRTLSKEWVRLKNQDDSEMKNMPTRSSINFTIKPTKNYEPYNTLEISHPLKNLLELSPPSSTTAKKGLIQKIVNKFGMTKTFNKPPQHKLPTSPWNLIRKTTSKLRKKQMKGTMRKGQRTTINTTEKAGNSCQLCDIDDTFKHIINLKNHMPLKEFEKSVTNITCYKYKKAPKCFILKYKSKKRNIKEVSARHIIKDNLRWDWIRRKRSLNSKLTITNEHVQINNNKTENNNDTDNRGELNQERNVRSLNTFKGPDKCKSIEDFKTLPSMEREVLNNIAVVGDNDDFETFERGEHGIYRRKKRSINNIEGMRAEIRNLPFTSKPREVYTMLGDSIIVQCTGTSQNQSNITWITDRHDMMVYGNVAVKGPKLYIRNVHAKNQGKYTCKKDNSTEKSIDLTVITLPKYQVLFTLLYAMDSSCTYEHLKLIRPLEEAMAGECCSNRDICSLRIDQPMCLRDVVNGSAYLRMTLAMTVSPRVDVKCSARCRRDLLASLALLSATNAPGLSSVSVIICKDDVNYTLKPTSSADHRRMVVTHTLRRRDSHLAMGRAFNSIPDTVSLLMICPAGYYLKSEQSICAACPSDSWSNVGDAECRRCPSGMRSDPGEGNCHSLATRVRRCDLLVCTSYGLGAVWLVALICAVSAAFRARKGKLTAETNVQLDPVPEVPSRLACHARPLSPSRVVLPKFLRRSRSSTEIADTNIGMEEKKNYPPPLPPIDFDL